MSQSQEDVKIRPTALSTVSSRSIPYVQSPASASFSNQDIGEHYFVVDPFKIGHVRHSVSQTMDDIPAVPLRNQRNGNIVLQTDVYGLRAIHSTTQYTPPNSPPLRPETSPHEVNSARGSRRSFALSQRFATTQDSLPLYHAHQDQGRSKAKFIPPWCTSAGTKAPIVLLDVIPRRLYLYLHFCLPKVYFLRVTRIFKEADISMPEIKTLALEMTRQKQEGILTFLPFTEEPNIPRRYLALKHNWETLIHSLRKEWGLLCIISALLLFPILIILQTESASSDSVTRCSGLFSAVFSLLSLTYGWIYFVGFDNMTEMHRAAEWAFEAQKVKTHLLWNVWVFLAMPAIWLSWSMVLFIVSIMSFVWRSGSIHDSDRIPPTSRAALGPRIAISALLGLGIVYLLLVLFTFRRYGEVLDEAWTSRTRQWMREKPIVQPDAPPPIVPTPGIPSLALSPQVPSVIIAEHTIPTRRPGEHAEDTLSVIEEVTAAPEESLVQPENLDITTRPSSPEPDTQQTSPSKPNSSPYLPSCKATKVIDMRLLPNVHSGYKTPDAAVEYGISSEDWKKFVTDVISAWDNHEDLDHPYTHGRSSPTTDEEAEDDIGVILERWNAQVFSAVGAQVLLCEEFPVDFKDDQSPIFAIYIVDCDRTVPVAVRFGAIPDGLGRIDICDPMIKHLKTSLLPNRTLRGGVGSDSSLSLEVVLDAD